MKIKILLLTLVFTLTVSFAASGFPQTAQAAFPGNNGKIAFTSDRDGNSEIYTMNADGSGVTRLTNNAATDFVNDWSPDGKRVAFSSNRDGNYEIYTMNADGTEQTRITSNTTNDFYAAWSPDSSKLAFTSERDGNPEIYVMNVDGSAQTRLTNATAGSYSPKWSPDGTKITYRDDRNTFDGEIYVMNADGTNQTSVANTAGFEWYPDWSPDGTSLSFTTSRDGSFNIYSMGADGSNQTRLTTTVNGGNFYFVGDFDSDYSPDGMKIIFRSGRDSGNQEIYAMNSDGSGQVRLTTNAASDTDPTWQPLIGTTTTDSSGHETTTISSSESYPLLDLTVSANQTLILDGNICDVVVESGGTLKGTGTACTITVEPGGVIAPGHSPGCLASGNLSLSGTYTAELAGTTPCSGYDQLQVTGTVAVGGALNVSLLNNFTPASGNVFTLINNDASDPVTGTFANLPEGATVSISGTQLRLSYVGGTGNDVTLTALVGLPGLPSTGNVTERLLMTSVLLSLAIVVISIGGYWAMRRGSIK